MMTMRIDLCTSSFSLREIVGIFLPDRHRSIPMEFAVPDR